ncbi:unnamed protein product, partial [marine sediment metagenome]
MSIGEKKLTEEFLRKILFLDPQPAPAGHVQKGEFRP